MENKIKKEDLIDVQNEITNASNELADNINKKYRLDAGLKKVVKPTCLSLLAAIISSVVLPANIITILLWALTVGLAAPTIGYAVTDFVTTKQVDELKDKVKHLETLKNSMTLDYQVENKRNSKTKKENIITTKIEEVEQQEISDKKDNINNI